MSRPRKDTIDTYSLILNLAKSGMNNIQIAEVTGLSRQTVQNYLSSTELGNALKEIRQERQLLDAEQKAKLNKSAINATKRLLRKRKSQETEIKTDEYGKLVYTINRTKTIEPNAGIVQFVLKNTDSSNWSDTGAQNIESESDSEIRIVIDDDK